MWNYNPKDAENVLPAGDYAGVLDTVTQKTSKAGNPMLAVKWIVYHDGGTVELTDYIVNPSSLFKLKKIARAIGKESEFKAGTFDLADHLNSNVTLTLKVESQAGYDDKNVVRDFKPSATGAAVTQTVPVDDPDLPF